MNFLLFFHQFHKKNKTKEKNDSQVSMRNYPPRGIQKLERKIVEKRAEAEKKGFSRHYCHHHHHHHNIEINLILYAKRIRFFDFGFCYIDQNKLYIVSVSLYLSLFLFTLLWQIASVLWWLLWFFFCFFYLNVCEC